MMLLLFQISEFLRGIRRAVFLLLKGESTSGRLLLPDPGIPTDSDGRIKRRILQVAKDTKQIGMPPQQEPAELMKPVVEGWNLRWPRTVGEIGECGCQHPVEHSGIFRGLAGVLREGPLCRNAPSGRFPEDTTMR
jgi:hypothetical protein